MHTFFGGTYMHIFTSGIYLVYFTAFPLIMLQIFCGIFWKSIVVVSFEKCLKRILG